MIQIALILILNLMSMQTEKLETATLGNGCFWCTDAIYSRVKGVESITPGFSGGSVKNPSYREVCTGNTGHAEVVRIEFDPSIISYAEILEIFFKTHDPTQLNRQGNDVGTQYRSVIFYQSEMQKKIATEIKEKLEAEKIWDKPIVTQIEAFEAFYPAEEYHDDYYENNPNQGYCRFVITPKVEKFEKVFKKYVK